MALPPPVELALANNLCQNAVFLLLPMVVPSQVPVFRGVRPVRGVRPASSLAA